MENQDEVLEFDLNASQKGVRTGLLTTASILSWIWGGLIVLMTGLMMIMKSFFFNTVMKEGYAEMDSQQQASLDFIAENFNNFFLFNLVAYAISIFAVIMMYRLKKIGFFIYAPLHIIITFYPYTYRTFEVNSGLIMSIAILVGFIAMYGVNLKHMD